jgi:tRNA U34 5-methylaminomethyl-2-thiouridine-forming methyltransferase MnmC
LVLDTRKVDILLKCFLFLQKTDIKMQRSIVTTGDGSKTIHIEEWNENYHSTHGAVQEAKHVFLSYGLSLFADKQEVSIFEVGFGTGLNAILTYEYAQENHLAIHYNSIEAYPVSETELNLLDYTSLFDKSDLKEVYTKLHSVSWDQDELISSDFVLHKIHQKMEDYTFPINQFDLIYFDAFGPRVQEQMWTPEIFQKLYDSLKEGGVLVTYCAKGQVKRDLKSVGFNVETLPGPPGKREMTRGRK